MEDNLVSLCVNSGIVGPSIENAKDVFPRWRSRLRKLGVDPGDVPAHPLVATTQAQVRAANLVTQFILEHHQSRANQATVHDIRTVTGIRPPKAPRLRKRRRSR